MKNRAALFRTWVLALVGALALAACTTLPKAQSASGPDGPIVLMIGIDGLRWDAIDRDPAPNLTALAARGVRAQGLVPVMPSLTFPNFYALATGLYPEHNGVLANVTYDRALDRTFTMTDGANDAFFEGEPIWITAERQGVKAATMFWVGSEAPVEGRHPSYWLPYDGTKSHDERVAQVLQWLDLPKAKRPRLILLYFSAVDSADHHYGVDSPQERAALADVDAHVGMLLEGIEARGLGDRINVIVVGDHGMIDFAPERIALDRYADLTGAYIPELARLDRANATEASIFADGAIADRIYRQLALADPRFTVYRKGHFPARYHDDHPTRAPDLLVVPEPGFLITLKDAPPPTNYVAGHGYDPATRAMQAGFIAAGPAFVQGAVSEPFENVNVYPLIAHILGLKPAKVDGSFSAVRHLLRVREK